MSSSPAPAPAEPHDPFAALLHRWWVEYNPLPLLSAALVLGGLTLVSKELAQHRSIGALGVGAIAEVYALSLIGGAALLQRIGRRRSAVMLGLLAAMWQGDLTMHLETSAYLAGIGGVASALWVALFAAKLAALAWALELRLSRSAFAVPTLGALGLAVLPHALRALDPSRRGVALTLMLFGLGALVLATERRVESAREMDERGRRALSGTWILWGALALAHIFYAAGEHEVDWSGTTVAVACLVLLGAARRERTLWIGAACALGAVVYVLPSLASLTAGMLTIVLLLRAARTRVARADAARTPAACPPYRSVREDPSPVAHGARWVLEPTASGARRRLIAGAVSSLYLAVWLDGWGGGALPAHALGLDAALLVALLIAAREARQLRLLTPLAPVALHLAAEHGLIHQPRGAMQWGLTTITLGFSLLLAHLALSLVLHRRAGRRSAKAGAYGIDAPRISARSHMRR